MLWVYVRVYISSAHNVRRYFEASIIEGGRVYKEKKNKKNEMKRNRRKNV